MLVYQRVDGHSEATEPFSDSPKYLHSALNLTSPQVNMGNLPVGTNGTILRAEPICETVGNPTSASLTSGYF